MKTTGTWGLMMLLTASAVPQTAQAAQAAPDGGVHRVLHNSDSREMLSASGRRFQIKMAWPDTPPPATGYPVVYLLDAGKNFGAMVDIVRRQQPTAIVVGIGYPGDLDAGTERAFDLTARLGSPPPLLAGTGGAEAFMAFVANELKPKVARRFSVDPARETIFGHGLGGHFILYALVNHPDMFDTWLAASPSIWVENRLLTKDNVRKRLGPKLQDTGVAPHVLITAGGNGPDADPNFKPSGPKDSPGQRAVIDAREYAAFLSGLPAIHARFQLEADGGHPAAVSAALTQGIRFAAATGAPEKSAMPRRQPIANPTRLPIPDKAHYMAMGAEGRYALRLQSRALPEAERKQWGAAFDHMLNAGLTYGEHRALAEEREAMDGKYGTAPHPD